MNEAIELLSGILGLRTQPLELSFGQVAARAVVVFVAAIAMVRVGDKRFLARMTAFDAVMGFVLASMLSRAINGSAAFFPSLGAGFVLVGVHRLVALAARHAHWFSVLVKGSSEPVVVDGFVQTSAMRRNHLSEQDLLEELRLEGKVESVEDVKKATMERNGKISVIRKAQG